MVDLKPRGLKMESISPMMEWKSGHVMNIYAHSFTTAQKMKFSIEDFFSKHDPIHGFLQIWSHLLKKSFMENFIFCAGYPVRSLSFLTMNHICFTFNKNGGLNHIDFLCRFSSSEVSLAVVFGV